MTNVDLMVDVGLLIDNWYSILISYLVSTTANALVLASDCLLVSLTWVKTVGIRRLSMQSGLRTPLSTLLLRDGKSLASSYVRTQRLICAQELCILCMTQ